MQHTGGYARTRLLWPDLARGLAVISMLFAHTAPAGGVLLIVEFLTAPLFATLVAVSMQLDWQNRGADTERWRLGQVLRGLTLIVLGELAQPLYAQIVIVLQALGFLTIALAMLVPVLAQRPRTSLALAVGTMLLSPVIMGASRTWVTSAPLPASLLWVVNHLASSPYYRLTTFLALGFVGLALGFWLHRHASRPRRLLVAAITLTVVTVGLFLVGVLTPVDLRPYSGTSFEITANAFLVAGSILWCAWATTAWPPTVLRLLDPLIATGRMALTAYLGQVVLLAYITRRFTNGVDDLWSVLASTTILLVGFCWAWQRMNEPRLFEALLRWPRVVETQRPPSHQGLGRSST